MEKTYQVKQPEDFKLVIDDILNWSAGSGTDNLIIALRGNLGVGKTAFTQELAKYLGVSEVVNSPTFTIMKQYEVDHERFDLLVHIDAYRLEWEVEARPLRLTEIFTTPRTLVCIEWPEIIKGILPESTVWMDIEITADEVREVMVRTEKAG